MSKFGETLFGGSRFIFWSLAPVLAACAAALPLLVGEWTAARVLFVALAEVLLVSLILALYDPRRFRWAARCVTGVVFCAYLLYLIDSAFAGGSSSLKPVMGFIVIGLPCLWYTIFGRFSRRPEGPREDEQEISEKVDATDFNL